VAILSSAEFNALTVDPATVRLEGASVKLLGNGGYQCSAQDVNGDSLSDLVCHVKTQEFNFAPGATTGVLEAITTAGTPIRGEDSVNLVP
jgi:hypothetical protein